MGIHIPVRKNRGKTVMEPKPAKNGSSAVQSNGAEQGLDQLFTAAYEELRRLAANAGRT